MQRHWEKFHSKISGVFRLYSGGIGKIRCERPVLELILKITNYLRLKQKRLLCEREL